MLEISKCPQKKGTRGVHYDVETDYKPREFYMHFRKVLRNNYLLVDVGDLNSKEKLTCKFPRAIVIINTILVQLSFVLKIDYT